MGDQSQIKDKDLEQISLEEEAFRNSIGTMDKRENVNGFSLKNHLGDLPPIVCTLVGFC